MRHIPSEVDGICHSWLLPLGTHRVLPFCPGGSSGLLLLPLGAHGRLLPRGWTAGSVRYCHSARIGVLPSLRVACWLVGPATATQHASVCSFPCGRTAGLSVTATRRASAYPSSSSLSTVGELLPLSAHVAFLLRWGYVAATSFATGGRDLRKNPKIQFRECRPSHMGPS